MFGIDNPVITERSWRMAHGLTAAEFSDDIAYAEHMRHPVHEWSGEDRDGRPLAVVWVEGRHSGAVLSAYEIAPHVPDCLCCTGGRVQMRGMHRD